MRTLYQSPTWFLLIVLLLANTPDALGQQKQPLDHSVYEIWNRITERAISDDGRWALFSLSPEERDAELRVKSLTSDQAYAIPRGVSARFSDDASFVAFRIKPPREAVRQAKRDKKKPDEQPKDSLGILNLATGEVVRVERVKSFKLPEEGNSWLAYLLEKPLATKDTTKAEEPKEEGAEKEAKEEDATDKKKKKDKKEGTPLVLRNLATGSETRYEHVTAYHFSEDGRWLVYTASSKDGSTDGIFAVETASTATTPIMTGEGVYTHVALDEAGEQVAFLSNRDDYDADQPAFSLYHWRPGTGDLTTPATEGTEGIAEGWWISEHGDVSFSKEGSRLFFGTAPRPEPEEEDEDVLESEKVVLDIWNWKDPLLQPMQLEQRDEEEKRTYRAVVHLADQRIVQLATETVPGVTVGSEGEADVAVGNSNMPYRQEISWDSPRYVDVYLVDVRTGERRRVLEKVQSSAQLSPEARYLTWWDRNERAWYAMAVNNGDPVNLTAAIPHPVYNELHDWPFKPSPYGNAGWTENDEAFLIYDKHDIWAVDPTGVRAPRILTEGRGRADNVRFRYVRLDPDEQAIDPDAPMLLSAFHLGTKESGYYRDRANGTREPAQLVMMDQRFGFPRKADDADRLLFTRESFVEFP
ncbi:MAG: hypothetical protein ACE5G0_12575, partial [Rhodothermales bacterium]